MRVEIVTPQGGKFSGDANAVKAVSIAGEVGVLPGHRDMLTALGTGTCVVTPDGDGEPISVLLDEGYLQVSDGGQRIIVVTEIAEFADEIDREAAQEAMQEAKAALDASDEAVGSEAWKVLRHRLALAEARLAITG